MIKKHLSLPAKPEARFDRRDKGKGKGKPHHGHSRPALNVDAEYTDDEADEDDEDLEDQEPPEQDVHMNEYDEDDDHEDEIDSEEEVILDAFYQGFKAKNKQGQKPEKGGKGKKYDKSRNKANSRCVDCGGTGHWKGDAACPKVQSGETPPFVPKKKERDVGVVEAADGFGARVHQF